MGKRDYDDLPDADAGFGPDPAKAGGGYVLFGWFLALAWIGACGAGLYAVYGVAQLLALAPVFQAALGALTVLPALLVLFCAAALREGARGRAQARHLADAAERMLSPSPAAESEARRLGVSVRGEIAALDRALDQTLQKVREVEAVIARQTMAVDSAAAMAQAGARSIVGGLERERVELMQIADDLNAQAGTIGQAISRHTRLIADAARLAEAEVAAADEALDSRLSSFGAAAALISDRTTALTKAAQASAESALRLETALSTALDSLAQATALTDAAKKSAETATFAANSTAGAVRETTLRAVDDAKRAAEMIRAEAASVERAGMDAIQRLREAASDARQAHSDVGFGRTPAEPEPRRRTEPTARSGDPGRAETFAHPRPETARPEPRRPETARHDPPRNETPRRPEPPRPEPVRPEPPRPEPQRAEPPRIDAPADPVRDRSPAAGGEQRWTWRDVIAAIDEDGDAKTARAPQARNPASGDTAGRRDDQRGDHRDEHAPEAPPTQAPVREPGPQRGGWGFSMRSGRSAPPLDPTYDRFRAADPSSEDAMAPPPSQSAEGALIASAGVSLSEVFSPAALERIGQRAKSGTQARRRAVRETAPDAVLRLAQHLDASPDARARAAAFLRAEGARISEMLGRGRAPLASDSTRAFLLLDAASA